MTDWDSFAVEADMLALASSVGVVRERHVELGPDDPAVPDSPEQRAARERRARSRAIERDTRRRNYRAAQSAAGHASPYPDVYETYRTRPVAEMERRDATVAELCNALHQQDPEKFTVAYLSERYGITPRSTE